MFAGIFHLENVNLETTFVGFFTVKVQKDLKMKKSLSPPLPRTFSCFHLNPLQNALRRATNGTLVEDAVVRGLGAPPVAYRGEIKCGNDIE